MRGELSESGDRSLDVAKAAPFFDVVTSSLQRTDEMRWRTTGAIAPGDVIDGKYRIERSIGAGGMGEVFSAWHLELDRPVAVKVVHAFLAAKDGVIGRFVRESRAMSRLPSPPALRIYDVGRLPCGAPFMVMELLEGLDLGKLLRRDGPFTVADAIDCTMQAAVAVGAAHDAGIVHRDLKPQNLFRVEGPDGPTIRVLDYGLAKAYGSDPGSVVYTETSDIVGTPHYMAPEQFVDARIGDPRCDVWALGATLYTLLTGRRPFDGPNLAGVCTSVLYRAAAPIERTDVDNALRAVVARCLEKEPASRYGSMEELVAALAACRTTCADTTRPQPVQLGRLGTLRPRRPHGTTTMATVLPAVSALSASVEAPAPPLAPRWPLGLLGIVAFVCAALAFPRPAPAHLRTLVASSHALRFPVTTAVSVGAPALAVPPVSPTTERAVVLPRPPPAPSPARPQRPQRPKSPVAAEGSAYERP